jgi:hypothetical protein
MGGAVGKQNKRLPRYMDVDTDHVRPANHTPLAEDSIGQGRFLKMQKRPLMSLVAGGARPPAPSSLPRPSVWRARCVAAALQFLPAPLRATSLLLTQRINPF